MTCISAGPTNTLAARGISGFGNMLAHVREKAPLEWKGDPQELAGTGIFLASDMSRKITGQVIYVDGGYEIMGM